MDKRILVISPDSGFGELMRQVLVEEVEYQVDLVPDSLSALAFAQENDYDLAVLDCLARDVPFPELTTALRDWHPALKLVLVPPDNDPDDPAIDHTNPDALLSKPFYLPDLLEVISNLLNDRPADSEPVDEPDTEIPAADIKVEEDIEPSVSPSDPEDPFPWLGDVNRAAQYLASLSLETSARAALIVREENLWAYAGELAQSAVGQVAETLGRQWGSQQGNDLARFIKLENMEYMLYATGLTEQLVLALIFDAKTPFSKVRSQSGKVARVLSENFDGEIPEEAEKITTQHVVDKGADRLDPALSDPPSDQSEAAGQLFEEKEVPEIVESDSLPVDWMPHQSENEADLLNEVEQTLEPFSIPPDWKPQENRLSNQPTYLEELLGEPIPSVSFPYEDHGGSSYLDRENQRSYKYPYMPAPETMAETRPSRVSLEDAVPKFDTDSNSYFDITYACMLVPRLPHHHLVSELAKEIEKWMFQICVSFDWRLDQLSIRPDYMQWLVKVHSATAPRFLMQIITRITSQRIFDHFSHLAKDNPSGEFWAPGWLVITSESLPSHEIVEDFVSKTRQRQGL